MLLAINLDSLNWESITAIFSILIDVVVDCITFDIKADELIIQSSNTIFLISISVSLPSNIVNKPFSPIFKPIILWYCPLSVPLNGWFSNEPIPY